GGGGGGGCTQARPRPGWIGGGGHSERRQPRLQGGGVELVELAAQCGDMIETRLSHDRFRISSARRATFSASSSLYFLTAWRSVGSPVARIWTASMAAVTA